MCAVPEGILRREAAAFLDSGHNDLERLLAHGVDEDQVVGQLVMSDSAFFGRVNVSFTPPGVWFFATRLRPALPW